MKETELASELKRAMKYRDGTDNCKCCIYFDASDEMGGARDCHPDLCTKFGEIEELEIEEVGYCRFYEKK